MKAFRPRQGVILLKAMTHPLTGRPLLPEHIVKHLERPGGPWHPSKLREIPGVGKIARTPKEAEATMNYLIEQARRAAKSERYMINAQMEREIRKAFGPQRLSATQRDLQRRIEEAEKGMKGEAEISTKRKKEEARVRARPYSSWREKGRGATLYQQLEREVHHVTLGPQSLESPFSLETGESTAAYLQRIRRGGEEEKKYKSGAGMREAIRQEAGRPALPPPILPGSLPLPPSRARAIKPEPGARSASPKPGGAKEEGQSDTNLKKVA